MEAAQLVVKVVVEGAQQTKSDLDEVDQKAKSAQTSLNDIAKGALAFTGINLGINAVAQGISYIADQDSNVQNVTANLTRLLGSAQNAQQAITNMQQFAANTPLEFNDIANATTQLLNFGYQLQQTQPLIQAIGDALGPNLNSASLQQVVMVFGQMHAGANLQTQDLRQLQSVGINAFQILADTMKPTQQQLDDLAKKGLLAGDSQDYLSGKLKLSAGDLQQLVTDGLVPSQQGIQDLTTGIEQSPLYKGGMATAAQTASGKLSSLKDNLTQLGENLSKPLFDAFNAGIGKAVDWSKQFLDYLNKNPTAMKIFQGVLITAAIIIGGVLVAAFVGWAISATAAAIATIAATWPILAIVAAVLALIAIIVILALNWNTIWGAISKFATDIWHGLQKDWNDLWSAIQMTFENIWSDITGFFKSGINDVIDLINDFLKLLDKVQIDLPGGGHVGINIPLIPHLAEGGNIISGGMALVGDAAEVVTMPQMRYLPAGAQVTPLSKMGRQTNVTINAATQNIDTNRLALILRMQDMLAGAA